MTAVAALEVRQALALLVVLARLLAFIETCVRARRRYQERLARGYVTFVVGTDLLEHAIGPC